MADKFSNSWFYNSGKLTVPDGEMANQDINYIQPSGTSRVDVKIKNSSGTVTTNQMALNASALTAGSVIFSDSNGKLSQDNANLFFDDALNQLRVGTTTNFIKMDGSGVTLGGTARTTKTISVDGGDFVVTTSNPASEVILNNFTLIYLCNPTVLSQVYSSFVIPDDYENGTNLTWSPVWATYSGGTGNCYWGLDYKVVRKNASQTIGGTPTTLTSIQAGSGVANRLQANTPVTVNGASFQAGDIFFFRAYRLGTSGSDTFADRALLVAYQFEYTSNKLGG